MISNLTVLYESHMNLQLIGPHSVEYFHGCCYITITELKWNVLTFGP